MQKCLLYSSGYNQLNRSRMTFRSVIMAQYGSGNDETVITEYLDADLENGIKQKNLAPF